MGNISFNQSPIDNRDKAFNELPIESVDVLADELSKLFRNEGYRKWYCKVIYEFGIEKVLEWKARSQEGNDPGRLFSKYVSDWRKYKRIRFASNPERKDFYDQ